MAHGDFAVMKKRTGEEVARGGSLEAALSELEAYEPRDDFSFMVVEYHNYKEIPLFVCSSKTETERKLRAKIGRIGGRHRG